MVTHAFNAMANLHHRKPGLLGAAITNSEVMCGLIADGQHVCSTMIEILLKASQYQQGIFWLVMLWHLWDYLMEFTPGILEK